MAPDGLFKSARTTERPGRWFAKENVSRTVSLVSDTLLFLTPKGVADCFKDVASSVLVGRYADFASLSAHRLASCMHDLGDTKQ